MSHGLRVSVAAGTGFEMLLHAAAVADPAWRGVFSDGTQAERDVVAARGRAYAREVSSFGRFGWINLLPLLACERPPWSIEQVQRIVTGHQPRDLHVALLGGRRRQLVLAVRDGVLTAAVDGDAAARA